MKKMPKNPNVIQFSLPVETRSKLEAMGNEGESLSLVAKRVLLDALDGGESTISSSSPDRLAELESKLEKLENIGSSVIAPHALQKIGDRLDSFDNEIKRLSSREWVQDNRDFIVKTMDEKGIHLIQEQEKELKLLGDRLEALEENMGFSADDLDKLTDEIKNRILSEGLKPLGDRLEALEAGQPEFHETINNLVERIENLEGWISSLRDDRALAKCSLAKFSDRLDALEKGSSPNSLREIPTGLSHKEMSAICGDAPSVLGKLAKNRERWPEGYMWSDESKKWFPMEMPTDSKIAKGLNHQEMAEICGVSLYEVTKLAHDRAKWPEGYMWSDESKKWFPVEC